MSASILNDGTGNRLVLTSNDSGAANSLKITVADASDASNTDNAGLSQLAYDPAGTLGNGRNLTETVTAQNALLKVDGIDNISRASNTVTDVIQGVTLTLLKQSAANTPTAFDGHPDTAGVEAAGRGLREGLQRCSARPSRTSPATTLPPSRAGCRATPRRSR
ncbi:MAG: flagellar filament capping protein FliD [Chromatiales bacterium]|nr:flagellar filament capping protein FliD [Chromatiales bacterium]